MNHARARTHTLNKESPVVERRECVSNGIKGIARGKLRSANNTWPIDNCTLQSVDLTALRLVRIRGSRVPRKGNLA